MKRVVCFYFFILFITGCDFDKKDQQIEYFKSSLESFLGDSDFVLIEAFKLTKFSWDKLCFKRNKKLELIFFSNKSEIKFELNYEEYFIDESYVKGSLDNTCVTPVDKLILLRKYKGKSSLIEFKKNT